MKERPIIFTGQLVRAILDGSKTQTRRVVKFRDEGPVTQLTCHDRPYVGSKREDVWWNADHEVEVGIYVEQDIHCPYGVPGDRLWVKETWQACAADGTPFPKDFPSLRDGAGVYCAYRASTGDKGFGLYDKMPSWRSARYMFRWASRITLELTDVRVERVQEISEEDARAEGIMAVSDEMKNDACRQASYDGGASSGSRGYFSQLWNSINAKRGYGWDANPYVWVLGFKTITG